MTIKIERKGNVIGWHAHLATFPITAFKVVSWDNKHSPHTQNLVETICRRQGITTERVFDGDYGRRYLLFVYQSPEQRKACFDFLAAIPQRLTGRWMT